ncbi:MAG: SpoIIE family protein phosphatase [Bacteroidota bacterium]
MSTQPNVTDIEAWQAEAKELLHRSTFWGLLVAIVTFCGGISLSSFQEVNWHLWFTVAVWFPAPVIIVAWLLYKYAKAPLLLPAYAIPISLLLSCAIQLTMNQDTKPLTELIIILSNVPTFVTTSLILFWKPKHAWISFGFAVIANLIAIQNRTLTEGNNFGAFAFVIPIALGSIALTHYRYTNNRKFFLVNRALNRSNIGLAETNSSLEEARKELAKKNQAVTDSIRYAKRIQTAILPDLETVKAHLPQAFFFYRPKDIVSGDFYWFHQVGEVSVLAVVDCTGHGVPGAFMSLIGANGLTALVVEQGLTDPAEILKRLDAQVSRLLQQNQNQQLRDGMEMVICAIRPEEKSITYASAHRPVFLVKDGEMIEHKGSRFPIGDLLGKKKLFENQQITLGPQDVVYLTTDGFADQFGGPTNSKYYKKRFKQFLTDISSVSMEQQQDRLAKELDDWQGATAQMDDVTVVGFRL